MSFVKMARKRPLHRRIVTCGTILLSCALWMGLSGNAQAQMNVPGTYSTTWLGNSFGASDASTPKWVQDWITTMAVATDGVVVAYGNYDENGNEAVLYQNGDSLGRLNLAHDTADGVAAALDATRVYLSAGEGSTSGVRVWDRASRNPIYVGNTGLAGNTLFKVGTGSKPVTGLAVTGTRLFASDDAGGKIRAYTLTNFATAGSWTVSKPRQIAVAGDGTLWIAQYVAASNNYKILHYQYNTSNNKATLLSNSLTLPSSVRVEGLTIDTSSATGNPNRMLIADNGVDQNVKIYGNLSGTPSLTGTFGVTGGMYAGTGAIIGKTGDKRFNGLAGAGTDSAGNVYVATNSGSAAPNLYSNYAGGTLEAYSAAGASLWKLYGLEFEDSANRDPLSDLDLYTKDSRYAFDYSAPAGQGWTYAAATLNRFKYPGDPRLLINDGGNNNANVWVRWISGKKFLCALDQISYVFQIYRFNEATDGEIAIPSVVFNKDGGGLSPNSPANSPWQWRDLNGNGAMDAGEFTTQPNDNRYLWGWHIDDAGAVWKAMRDSGIRKHPCAGLDAIGNPIFNNAAAVFYPLHTPFTTYHRIQYNVSSDKMYLSGWTTQYPQPGDNRDMGRVIARFSNWNANGATATIAPDYQIVTQYTGTISPQSFVQAGEYIFVLYYDTGTQTARYVEVYKEADGTFVGRIYPGPEVGGQMSDVDTPNAIQAFQRITGEYIITASEYNHAKVLLFRWTPPNTNPPTTVDDTNAAIAYTNFAVGPGNGRYGGTNHETNVSGATAQFTFTGTHIALLGERQPYGGQADVFIDNQLMGRISFYADTAKLQQAVFSKSGLTAGSHTVKIVNAGTSWIYCDAFQYRP